jgi:hypothetical protein
VSVTRPALKVAGDSGVAGTSRCSEITSRLGERLGGRGKEEELACSERSSRIGSAEGTLAVDGGPGVVIEAALSRLR